MKHAFKKVEAAGRPALTFAAGNITSITAETQRPLWPEADIPMGYLDLVLNVLASDGRSEIWVEVKVDAPESGNQLENYRRHASQQSQPPAIITLARMQISPSVPFLKWSDIADGIESVSQPHHSWISLLEFLRDERIVRPPVPSAPVDADAFIEIIVAVNQRIRNLWPRAALAWADGALRKSLDKSFKEHHDLVTSGGPLRYGLMTAGKNWEWAVVVTTKNYQRVRLDAQQMLRDAALGGLSEDWIRDADRFEVFERRLTEPLDSHDEIVAWFEARLKELRDAKILDRYLAGLATKGTTMVDQAVASVEADEQE